MSDPVTYALISAGITAVSQGVGLAVGGAQQAEQDKRRRREEKERKKELRIANAMEMARVERANQRISEIWNLKLARYNQQLEMNAQAAERGYIAEQMGAQDDIAAFMFQQVDLLKELTRSAGESAARGFTSRSAQMAELKDVWGEYHRNRMMSSGNLGRQLEGRQGAIEQVSMDEFMSNLAAHSEVAIQPELEVFRPVQYGGGTGSSQNLTGLKIGRAAADTALEFGRSYSQYSMMKPQSTPIPDPKPAVDTTPYTSQSAGPQSTLARANAGN